MLLLLRQKVEDSKLLKKKLQVCEMNDLEDGLDFRDKGQFFWLTEKGTKIEEVTYWCELPTLV